VTADLVLQRSSPLGATATAPFALIRSTDVEIDERPFLAQVLLRMPPTDPGRDAVATALGVRLPDANRLERAAAAFRLALWMGPDEWLVVDGSGDSAALASALQAATASHGGTVVDVSAQRTLLELRGPGVTDLLAAGCSVDLHPSAFAVGHAVQTMLARVDVIIGRGGPETYHVAVRTSFAPYLVAWMRDAVDA
jgi:sarcosine oxidase subunit gamma